MTFIDERSRIAIIYKRKVKKKRLLTKKMLNKSVKDLTSNILYDKNRLK